MRKKTKTKSKKALLTVFGKDRPGIIAEVTGVLFESKCNLEDVSMTILEGEFAMMLILSFVSKTHHEIETRLNRLRSKWNLVFFWKEIDTQLHRGEKHTQGSTTYLINAIGRDRTGIVYQISKLLADFRLNITDLNSKILGRGSKALYAMMLEADMPPRFNLSPFRRALDRLSRKLKVEIQIKPLEPIEF